MDRIETNEGVAAQYTSVEREFGLDQARADVNGGAVVLDHPVGPSGAGPARTLLSERCRGRRPGVGRGSPPPSRHAVGWGLVGLGLLGLVFAAVPPAARAADGGGAVSPLLLDLLAPRPIESHESALNQSLREAGPPPRPAPVEGRVLPDGSVQYGEGRGSVVVTVRQGGSGSGNGVRDLGFPRDPSGLRTH